MVHLVDIDNEVGQIDLEVNEDQQSYDKLGNAG